jgi:ribosomal protein S18 acetylase RimI-like enzyme
MLTANRVEQADPSDARWLAELIYLSGPENLQGVFSGHHADLTATVRKKICIDYLCHAVGVASCQFGFQQQFVIRYQRRPVGCVSYWQYPLSDNFKKATLTSLVTHFSGLECANILQNSQHLASLVTVPTQQQLSIGHLAVALDMRRQGIAKTLLSFCQQQAKKLGKSELILDLAANNRTALTLYQGFGFEQVGISKPNDTGVQLGLASHIHMRKNLDSI